MTDARTRILSRLQRARRKPSLSQACAPSVTCDDDIVKIFQQGLEKVSASFEYINSRDQIHSAIEHYLNALSASKELIVAPAITDAGLLDNSRFKLTPAPSRGNEENAVTLAYAGIAETGSLVLLSAADTPMTTNFLADNFICILKANDILASMEALWARIQAERDMLPRCINIITGPSRTADVEQTIQLGAHGPRRVHVMLLQDAH